MAWVLACICGLMQDKDFLFSMNRVIDVGEPSRSGMSNVEKLKAKSA